MRYFTSDVEPDVRECPFPRLDAIRKALLRELYEAEFIDDQEVMDVLKDKINSIDRAIGLGEVYEIPF